VSKRHRNQPQHRDVGMAELEAIVERATTAPLSAEDSTTLMTSLQTLGFLQQELKAKGTSIEKLRRIAFGAMTEKTSNVFPKSAKETGAGVAVGEKKPGHGRNGAAAYKGANKVKVAHPSLVAGQTCACCEKGKVYPLAEPAVMVRITGMAPLGATVFERERLRCNLCGEVFTAPAPEGVGEAKYDETATAMTGLLKYGTGVPFNRLEQLEKGMGIPVATENPKRDTRAGGLRRGCRGAGPWTGVERDDGRDR
jgi:hypothetical protein